MFFFCSSMQSVFVNKQPFHCQLNPFQSRFWAATNSAIAKQKNRWRNAKKLDSSGSSHHSLAPHLLFLISVSHTLLFSVSSITSHLVSISQGPFSELPAHYVSPTRAGRKSLERSKPFISRGDLICVQQDALFPAWGYICPQEALGNCHCSGLNFTFTETYSLKLVFMLLPN